jgi:hypothetical protein
MRIVGFCAATLAFWALALYALGLALFGTCGMGPDAICNDSSSTKFLLTLLVSIISYAALCVVFFRKPKRGL